MVMEMMVFDNEAHVEVNQEVDKEVTKVVELVDKELVNKGMLWYVDMVMVKEMIFQRQIKVQPTKHQPGG